jgi:imidazole glycerol-phosphate synthase subunit HisH
MSCGVVDYNAGNLTSVSTALKALGADFFVSSDPARLEACERIIFPGVGEASYAMEILARRGLDRFLIEYAATGRPLLGICLGCQIVLERSEEGDTECLGLLPGTAVRFPEKKGLKVPQIGWNALSITKSEHPLLRDIPQHTSFYFVHSYYPRVEPDLSLLECEYGLTFSAGFAKGNVAAFQFHPEKSGPFGLRLLKNFLAWKGGSANV